MVSFSVVGELVLTVVANRGNIFHIALLYSVIVALVVSATQGIFIRYKYYTMKVGKKQQPRYLPRVRSVRDEIRKIYKEAGILEALPPIRQTPTHLERALTARGISASLANVMTVEEGLEFLAAESGLEPGITSATLPERLTFAWLKQHGYSYGGTGPSANINMDFTWQVPLNGGKNAKGGSDIDFFLSSRATGTAKGTTLFIDGLWAHSRNGVAERDAATDLRLTAQGYVVARITDTETASGGILDARLRQLLLPK